ncbi:DUF6678 family protein [Aureimonas sp. ME7]|uniref:DUF6678 family protein n=1 Tax=Aureimonas sp. ME7 TaxID=2744252 RepID=UPI001FCEE8E5|nr:DUF6678 family protein [Aureimonas sp. ME7]
MRHACMNNTKWNEIRLEMLEIQPRPLWSTLSTHGHRYPRDGEWFYHFSAGGYDDILLVDIFTDTLAQRELVRAALKRVHVPGEETAEGFRVFGYLRPGQAADYI